MTTRIHIADDHTMFRAGLQALLQECADIEIVGETGDGSETLEWLEGNDTDVLLLDINMPGMSGADVARELANRDDGPRILVLTMHDDEHYLREFLELGCRGFILKSSAGEELLRAIRMVDEGQSYVDPAMSKYLLSSYVGGDAGEESPADVLTKREQEVCQFLAMGHTNEEVAGALCISRRTVEAHRAAIMSKLGISSRAELVRFAVENGLFSL